jgi:hypothetical protein
MIYVIESPISKNNSKSFRLMPLISIQYDLITLKQFLLNDNESGGTKKAPDLPDSLLMFRGIMQVE